MNSAARNKPLINVLFVCLGNICRSPTAQGVFTSLVRNEGLDQSIQTESAGTGAWHSGSPPDHRAQLAALARGYDLSSQRARKVIESDFRKFNYILAMDRQNYEDLSVMAPPDTTSKIKLFLTFVPNIDKTEIPDPYYGGQKGFDHIIDLIEAASYGLLRDIQCHHIKQNRP